VILEEGESSDVRYAKLADQTLRVKPETFRQRGAGFGGSKLHVFRRLAVIVRADLNYSNRPVRTRMPGGVGGVGQLCWPTLSQCAPGRRFCS
jgi:hypothetical protein